jgi:hypothetical protein
MALLIVLFSRPWRDLSCLVPAYPALKIPAAVPPEFWRTGLFSCAPGGAVLTEPSCQIGVKKNKYVDGEAKKQFHNKARRFESKPL